MSLITDYLTERRVAFQVVPHRRAFTSLQQARELGVAAEEVLKTVALWTGGKYVLAVVPASRRLELRRARQALEDPRARLASEAELQADFPGYGLGAMLRWSERTIGPAQTGPTGPARQGDTGPGSDPRLDGVPGPEGRRR
jgi:prolyl-tRNA editing enzyme YbaK/EbsC (Cys-tRNA(Pro) deacylase)